jgi:hypothetical protein
MLRKPLAVTLVLPFAVACGGKALEGEEAPAATVPTAAAIDGGAEATAASVDHAAACTTTFADGTPELFRRYFRCVDVALEGADVVVRTRSLPPYSTYYYGPASPKFAPFDTSRGPEFHPNPNLIAEQRVALRIPLAPAPRADLVVTRELVDGMAGGPHGATEYRLGPAGVALNGVALFSGVAARGGDIEVEKYTFDAWNGHPDPRGGYHYHGVSAGPLAVLAESGLVTTTRPGAAELELYGVMCDGAVVLGCTEMDGDEPARADLDAQNGHVHDVRDRAGATLAAARYHVHLCSRWADASRILTPEVQYYDRCGVP